VKWQKTHTGILSIFGQDRNMAMPFETAHGSLRRIVRLVALLNLGYFAIEFIVAIAIGSVSLFADSIDFMEDASVNLLIAVALDRTLTTF